MFVGTLGLVARLTKEYWLLREYAYGFGPALKYGASNQTDLLKILFHEYLFK